MLRRSDLVLVAGRQEGGAQELRALVVGDLQMYSDHRRFYSKFIRNST